MECGWESKPNKFEMKKISCGKEMRSDWTTISTNHSRSQEDCRKTDDYNSSVSRTNTRRPMHSHQARIDLWFSSFEKKLDELPQFAAGVLQNKGQWIALQASYIFRSFFPQPIRQQRGCFWIIPRGLQQEKNNVMLINDEIEKHFQSLD